MAHLIKLELKKFGTARNIILRLPQSFSAYCSLLYLCGIV